MRRDLLLLCAAVLLIRLPFVDQAVQGDDVYYLLIGSNALADPLHPMQMGFRYEGQIVWAAGHTRPPLNAYVLAGLLALFGEVRETYFHLAYLLFSLLAVISMYFLARRFTERPLLATLLLIATPAFLVNGNKLEADLPLLALWLAGFALFVHRRFLTAAVFLAGAGLCAYQAVFGLPVLAHYTWYRCRNQRQSWLAIAAAPVAIAAWQLFERATTGTAPATVLAGYFSSYNLLALETKLGSTLALTAHLGFMVSPLLVVLAWRPLERRGWLLWLAPFSLASIPALWLAGYSPAQRLLLWVALGTGFLVLAAALQLLLKDRASDDAFLAAWIVAFFACAIVVFYAGSARYLLPIAAPLALLVARRVSNTALLAGVALLHMTLGLALARAEYEYDNQYRAFAERLAPLAASKRLWTNAEWGLRYYLGRLGADPLLANQTVYADSIVVTSELAAGVPFETEAMRTELLRADIATASMPLRTIGLGARSGYSSSNFGALPFDFGAGLIDRVAAYEVGLAEPTTGYLTMNAPEAEQQLLSGFYQLEDGQRRWMGKQGAALLLVPADASQFEVVFYISPAATARRVTVTIDGETIAEESFPGEGLYTMQAPYTHAAGETIEAVISVDQTFQSPGDDRELGVVVFALGVK